jgi:hypothetical protein
MRDRLFDAAEKVAGYTNFRWHFSVKSGSQEFRLPSAQEGLAAFGTRLGRLGLRADGKDSYTGHPVL